MVEIFFDPTASATAYGQRPKFVKAEGENCAYSQVSIKRAARLTTHICS